jgi:microcystin-dependent protein
MSYLMKLFITGLLCTIAINQLHAQTNALKIQPDGNIGIGTETPTEKLQVDGNVKANGRFMDKTGVVMPVGTILPFAGMTPPPGWLLCDGAAYSTTGDQKDLYAVITTLYGTDGSTKFRVPDLRGTFTVGAGAGDGIASRGEPDQHNHGVTVPERTFNTSWAGSHTHRFPASWYPRSLDKGAYTGIDTGGDDVKYQSTQEAGNHYHQVTEGSWWGATGYSNDRNRPKWIALNYIIKY